jgi:hypothetical protein
VELEAAGSLERKFHILGGPLSVELERIVACEASKEKWDALVEDGKITAGIGDKVRRKPRACDDLRSDSQR